MITYFIKNPKVVALITLAIVIGGIISLLAMRREAFPNVDFAMATITTFYPGATPEDVEIQVTKKIEDELRGIEGIKQTRSISQEGYSEITIVVDIDNVSSREVLDEVQRTTDRVVDLPAELPDPPHFNEIKTKHFPVLEVSVLGDVDEEKLRKVADQLEDVFDMNSGVAAVNKIGYREREYRIYIDPVKMGRYHVSFNEVIRAIGASNVDTPGGIFESRPFKKSVRTVGSLKEAEMFLDVVVRTNLSGQVIRVRDIATVDDTYEDPRVVAKTNGKPSIILVAMKKEHTDILKLTKELKEAIAEFRKGLPEGVGVIVSNDESERTRTRLDIIISNSIIGFFLMLIALIVFLDLRNALVTSLAAPIVILVTLILMSFLGITFNMISMLAVIIALGMFVDNSIVISENIFRLKQTGLSMEEAAMKGTIAIAAPITATVLTTIAAFVPMMVTSGVMGQFIIAIPIVVTCSLLASLFDSFFLLPARIIALDREAVIKESRWFAWWRHLFESFVRFFIRYKWSSIALANLLLIGALIFAVKKIDFILFPPEGVDRFAVKYLAHPGTPIEDVNRGIEKVENALMSLPSDEVYAITTRTGVQQMGLGDPLSRVGDNVGMILVYLTPENERKRTAAEIISWLRENVDIYEPFEMIQFETLAMGPPVGKAVTVSVQGDDLEKLKELAGQIWKFLSDIDGVTDIDQDLKPGIRQLRVEINKGVREEIGLTVAEIAAALRTAQEGVIASKVRKYDDDIDVRVLFSKEARGSMTSLENLLISDVRGNLIPLHKVANIREVEGPEPRRHFDYRRSITITAGVDTDKVTSVEVNAALRKAFAFIPEKNPGYVLKFGGEEESTMESMSSLARAMVFAIIGIFSILVALFGSYALPFLIMFSIPLGFVGVIVGFAAHDKPFGFLAIIGMIGLSGVIVNSAIVLIAFIEDMRKNTKLSLEECLVQSAGTRLRPILLTTFTTVLALFPTAYGIGGFDPMLVPMTLAMAWGLLFGTLLTLLVIPCGYAVIEDVIQFSNRVRGKKGEKHPVKI
ncbi:MAG: efflux RND transporter permease subunit [Nitrospinota bacterium]|nr:efflux RND transporter permease subunit [Nitrospinota bacterium]